MKIRATVLLVLVVLSIGLFPVSGSSAETSVSGEIYGQWMIDLSNAADNFNEFSLSRSYLTVKSALSDYTSVRVTSDLRTIDNKYDIILKYGYFDWTPAFGKKYLRLRMGLQPTLYIDEMNNLWGRRYLEKTIGDRLNFLTSSDLGLSATFNLDREAKLGFVNVSIFNGTSYSNVAEKNAQKDINILAELNPLSSNSLLKKSKVLAQFYSGTQNEVVGDSVKASDWKKQIASIGGLLVYNDAIDLGFDLNYGADGAGPGNSEIKKSGISVFSSVYLEKLAGGNPSLKTLNLFGRADIFDPDTGQNDDGQTLIIAGIECAPAKGFKASIDYRMTSFENAEANDNKSIYLNTLAKF